MEQITLTNPSTGEKWTSGKRGAKPKWVTEILIKNNIIVPKSQIVKSDIVPLENTLTVWKYVGQNDEDGKTVREMKKVYCYIIANNPSEALLVANKTFKSPMSSNELNLMWNIIDDPEKIIELNKSGVDVFKPGIWEGKGGNWICRKVL